jgi:type II secretory pathway component PulL
MSRRVLAVAHLEGRLLLLKARRRADRLVVERVESLACPDGNSSLGAARDRLAGRGLLGLPTVLVLPARMAFVCLHRPGIAEGKALTETIRYDVEGELPAAVDEMSLDFDCMDGEEAGKARVLVGAALKGDLQGELDLLKGLGLTPQQVTPGAVSLGNAYRALGLANGDGRLLALHVTGDGIQVVRLNGRGTEDVRAIYTHWPEAGEGLGLPPLGRSSVMESVLAGDVEGVYLSGTDALRQRAAGWLRDEASLRVSEPSLQGLDAEGLSEDEMRLLREEGLPLIGAAGEALGFRAAAALNLLDARQQAAGWLSALRKPLSAGACLMVLLVFLWAAAGLGALAHTERLRHTAEADVSALWNGLHPGMALPVDPARTLRSEAAGLAGYGPYGRRAFGTLDALRKLTAPLSEAGSQAAYRQVRITRSGVSLQGAAASYAAVDILVQCLRQQGGFDVASPEMSRQPGAVTFRLTVRGGQDE